MAGSPAATCRVASPVFPACSRSVLRSSCKWQRRGRSSVSRPESGHRPQTVRPPRLLEGCPRRLSRLVGTLRLVALGQRARGPQDDGRWLDGGAVRVRVGHDSAARRGETPPSATTWTDLETITLSDKPGGKRGKPRRHLHVGEKPEGHKGTGQTEPRGHGPQTSAYQRVGVGGCLGSSPTSPSRRRWPQPLSLPRGLHIPSSVSQPPFLSKKHSVREFEDLLKDCFFVKNSQRSDSGFLF